MNKLLFAAAAVLISGLLLFLTLCAHADGAPGAGLYSDVDVAPAGALYSDVDVAPAGALFSDVAPAATLFSDVAPAGARLAFDVAPAGARLAFAPGDSLRVVLIRHAEKPKKGDNLNCKGLNRSYALPAVLYSRFGLPAAIFVPAMETGDKTKHARMFETVVPLAAKYNLSLTSRFREDDTTELAQAVRGEKGTVLIVWEHSRIAAIARSLGVRESGLDWPDEDYDSIWIITFRNGRAEMERSKEGLTPKEECAF